MLFDIDNLNKCAFTFFIQHVSAKTDMSSFYEVETCSLESLGWTDVLFPILEFL